MLFCLLNDKKALNKYDLKTLHKRKIPFGCRVIYQGYSLMSCPGLLVTIAELIQNLLSVCMLYVINTLTIVIRF